MNYPSHKSPFFKMLAGICLKFELFLIWSIDQSCIIFILSVKWTLKSLKNAVSECENVIFVAVICKKSTQANPEKKRHDTLLYKSTHTHTYTSKVCHRWAEERMHLNTWKSVYSFRQLCFANHIFRHSEKSQTCTANLFLALYPHYD